MTLKEDSDNAFGYIFRRREGSGLCGGKLKKGMRKTARARQEREKDDEKKEKHVEEEAADRYNKMGQRLCLCDVFFFFPKLQEFEKFISHFHPMGPR